ncbi:DUF2062 domain-containing protein [Uliginosibacterium sp. H3]|uniref:DUF2062 domain-containing protein n=1 Tax=Uliginosibacterium silvisoli TaxID=3114758 RepID=A0ABU6K9C5_9RHOO|nr:DUF2062 domain-containing protein [Uliginosibacterium sp. H3]
MRKFFQRYTPDHATLGKNRVFAMLGKPLQHPCLWHLNRHSAARGIAIGMFCGLIPGPLQMLGAAIACIVARANLPLALATTFYTNPLTIVPLYLVAFTIGRAVTGSDAQFVMPPEKGAQSLLEWGSALMQWLISLGKPLAFGLPVLAVALAVAGYFAVKVLWRLHVQRALKRRRARHAT